MNKKHTWTCAQHNLEASKLELKFEKRSYAMLCLKRSMLLILSQH